MSKTKKLTGIEERSVYHILRQRIDNLETQLVAVRRRLTRLENKEGATR